MDSDPMIDDEVGAHTRVTVLVYWKFESVSLQQTVSLSWDFFFLYRKAGICRSVCEPGQAAWSAETRSSSTSRQLQVMSLSGPIPVPQHRCAARWLPIVVALVRQARSGHPRTLRYHQARSSVRLRQSQARSAARARQVADVNGPAACLRSDRAADDRREWLR